MNTKFVLKQSFLESSFHRVDRCVIRNGKIDFAGNENPTLIFCRSIRQFCLVCGRMAKNSTGMSSAFYGLDTFLMSTTEEEPPSERTSVGGLLKNILRVDLPKKKLIPSDDICKKCYRQLNEIRYMEQQVNTKQFSKCTQQRRLRKIVLSGYDCC